MLQILAWAALLILGAITLSPIEFRPRLPGSVELERALAFFVVGLMFAIAYPRKIWFAIAVVLVGVVSLEAMQELRPDRHGRVPDALVKALGGVMGIFAGRLFARLLSAR